MREQLVLLDVIEKFTKLKNSPKLYFLEEQFKTLQSEILRKKNIFLRSNDVFQNLLFTIVKKVDRLMETNKDSYRNCLAENHQWHILSYIKVLTVEIQKLTSEIMQHRNLHFQFHTISSPGSIKKKKKTDKIKRTYL